MRERRRPDSINYDNLRRRHTLEDMSHNPMFWLQVLGVILLLCAAAAFVRRAPRPVQPGHIYLAVQCAAGMAEGSGVYRLDQDGVARRWYQPRTMDSIAGLALDARGGAWFLDSNHTGLWRRHDADEVRNDLFKQPRTWIRCDADGKVACSLPPGADGSVDIVGPLSSSPVRTRLDGSYRAGCFAFGDKADPAMYFYSQTYQYLYVQGEGAPPRPVLPVRLQAFCIDHGDLIYTPPEGDRLCRRRNMSGTEETLYHCPRGVTISDVSCREGD
jgi:hypothetical protein